jgi:hypothetical protein
MSQECSLYDVSPALLTQDDKRTARASQSSDTRAQKATVNLRWGSGPRRTAGIYLINRLMYRFQNDDRSKQSAMGALSRF